MKAKIFLIIIICSFIFGFKKDDPVLTSEELSIVTGEKWTGKLGYLDYQSNKEVFISSELMVFISETDKNIFIFNYEYPKEPAANSFDTVIISEDGRKIEDEIITGKNIYADSTLEIITTNEGTDDERKATFSHKYLISANKFSVKKEVKLDGETEFFKRSEYVFER